MPKTQERGRTPHDFFKSAGGRERGLSARELLNLAARRSQDGYALAERAAILLGQAENLNREAERLIVLASISERGAA